MFEIKNGGNYNAAGNIRCTLIGHEIGSLGDEVKDSCLISLALPAEWGISRTDELLDLFIEFCSMVPFLSAQAGYNFEWSRYDQLSSQLYAWEKSMKFPGLDIAWPSLDRNTVKEDSIRGVGRLTALCDNFANQIGGKTKLKSKLSKHVELIEIKDGLILRAGSHPGLGNIDAGDYLPAYQEVYKILKSLLEPAHKRAPSFSLQKNRRENTDAWLRRFDASKTCESKK